MQVNIPQYYPLDDSILVEHVCENKNVSKDGFMIKRYTVTSCLRNYHQCYVWEKKTSLRSPLHTQARAHTGRVYRFVPVLFSTKKDRKNLLR